MRGEGDEDPSYRGEDRGEEDSPPWPQPASTVASYQGAQDLTNVHTADCTDMQNISVFNPKVEQTK